MAIFMVQIAFSTKTWVSEVRGGRPNVTLKLIKSFEKSGGGLFHVYYAFGEYDVVAIGELPDNASAASLSATLSAAGIAKEVKTTPLMTEADAAEAMLRAGGEGW